MEKLDDDSLIEIFKYLPITDRIRLEAVSRKWQRLIKMSWCSVKYFTLRDRNTWQHHKRITNFQNVINDKVFKSLLQRFGRYLISVDLNSKYGVGQNRLTSKSIGYLKQFCPNLQALNLGKIFEIYQCDVAIKELSFIQDISDCEPRISKIAQSFQNWKVISNLKEFHVKVCHADLKNLARLISKMEKLECLQIAFDGSFLRQDISISGLPFNTLNEIIFEFCWAIDEQVLIDIIIRIPNLRTLVLMDLRTYNILRHLLPFQYKALENLRVCVYDNKDAYHIQNIRIAQSFVNLTKLNLSVNNCLLVTDEFLKIMVHHCTELIFLDLSENYNLTDSGIQHLISLPKLQCLFINHLHKINGKTLNKMDNLEVLDCSFCANVEDDGLCALIKQSKLRIIDLRSCKKITNKLLDAAIQEVQSRKEKMDLTLMIDDTRINLNGKESEFPLLRIVQEKYVSKDFYKLHGYYVERNLFGMYF